VKPHVNFRPVTDLPAKTALISTKCYKNILSDEFMPTYTELVKLRYL
jgi:hypothetical protein